MSFFNVGSSHDKPTQLFKLTFSVCMEIGVLNEDESVRKFPNLKLILSYKSLKLSDLTKKCVIEIF